MTRESLDPYFRPSKDSIPRAIVWMRLPELPIEYWKRDFALRIVAAAGRPIEIDTYTRDLCKGSFARACLEVDLTKPLVGNQDRNHRRGRKALVFEIRKKSLRDRLIANKDRMANKEKAIVEGTVIVEVGGSSRQGELQKKDKEVAMP